MTTAAPRTLVGKDGDSAAGFEVAIDASQRILVIRGWGVWDVALAMKYRDVMLSAFRKLRGQPWSLLSDRRRSHPQPEAVQAIIVEVMTRATALGRVKAAVLVEGAVANLQMRRLAQKASTAFLQRVFSDEAEAMTWLAGR